jgi:two-component sensor histidine kinase
MIKDTEGNYWMTSYGEGIIRFRDTAFKVFDASQGLPSNSVNDVAEWNGTLLMATNDGLFSLTDGMGIQKLIAGGILKKLLVNSENHLLYTTETAVYKLKNIEESPELVDEGAYSLLFADRGKTFLFGTDKIKVLTAADSTYFIKSRRSITMAPIADRYVLCKIGGLFQLKGTEVDTIPGLNPKEHNDFRSLDALNANELLAANEKRLYHLSLRNGKYDFQIFEMARFKGLKHFRALKVDGPNLWLAGRDAIFKVDLEMLLKKDSVVQKKYATVAHFLENDIDFNSLFIAENKTVFASSLSGMLAVDEDAYLPNKQPPTLDLSEILLFSEPLDDSLYRTEKGLVLPYQKNYLTFSMEAITFTNPENVRYRYRMKGLRDGDEWTKPTKESTVVFSYLPPGDYTFEFMADNGDGVWQERAFQYSFVITVPFWKTGVFWVLVVAFSGFAIFLIYFFRNKALQKRNEIYTHNLIKAQEEERTRVARELHDSVGQKLMLLTKKTKSTGNADMESLASNTLEELRSISRGLHPAILERLGPTAAIRNMVDEVDSNTPIFFTHEIDDIDALLPREAALHLYRIIQEVLNNMVKHAEAKAASVFIEVKNNAIEATIADNGKGFEPSEKTKALNSLGMKTILERAKILHSKIDIKSQPNKGTTITLTIPI